MPDIIPSFTYEQHTEVHTLPHLKILSPATKILCHDYGCQEAQIAPLLEKETIVEYSDTENTCNAYTNRRFCSSSNYS